MGVAGDGSAEGAERAETAALAVSQRWWDEVWRDGNLDAVDSLFTDPFTRHTGTGSDTVSRATFRGRLAEVQRVLWHPDTTIDDRAVAGDRVWTRATSRGVNRETGEPSVVTWLIEQRIEGDRIAEHWVATHAGIDWT